MILLVGGVGWVHFYASLIVLDMGGHKKKDALSPDFLEEVLLRE